VGDLPLNYPAPTYVCRASGNKQSTWSDLSQLKNQILLFPINRCDEALPGNPGGQLLSGSTTEAACSQTPGQYDIIGFFAAKLINVYDPNAAAGGSGPCSTPRVFPGPNNPFTVYSMFEATQANPCPATAPDQISNVVVGKVKKQDPGQAPVLNTDYVVDYTNAADPSITWLPGGPANEDQTYKVSFDWSTGGKCGVPPSGNNAGHCLVLQPVAVKIGGKDPGGGGDGNLEAFKLCDANIGGSCDPVNVPNP
jgi:hypothetical protein